MGQPTVVRYREQTAARRVTPRAPDLHYERLSASFWRSKRRWRRERLLPLGLADDGRTSRGIHADSVPLRGLLQPAGDAADRSLRAH